MKDPVALAYSGRLHEARIAALAQASSDEAFLVAQGLEALAVLGQQHGARADAEVDALLSARLAEFPQLAGKVFEAAASLGSRAVEEAAARRLAAGDVGWALLRYVGEWPSLRLARGLAAGWDRLPARLRDLALLTACAVPAASREEALAWGLRAASCTDDADEEVRVAAFTALARWAPDEAAKIAERGLSDESVRVRMAAARALAWVDAGRLEAVVEQWGDEVPEAKAALGELPPKRLLH